ncbi:MAG: hypothetical protein LBC61_03890 [Candidatus Peribacteria bacterium]|jgi:hypothetical protein|nr:hypothetical protein [Candidatus Peribacteria bacterium]
MPEVVQSWVENQDIEKIGNLQNNILNSYLFDFSKHTESSVSKKINQIWNSIPKQFAKENDKFVW